MNIKTSAKRTVRTETGGNNDPREYARSTKAASKIQIGRPRERDICWRKGRINGNLINPDKPENKGDVRLIRSSSFNVVPPLRIRLPLSSKLSSWRITVTELTLRADLLVRVKPIAVYPLVRPRREIKSLRLFH